MFRQLRLIRQYIGYYWQAATRYDVHSPFVSDFIAEVLEDERHFYAFDEIEHQRYDFLNSSEIISVEDFGAGSHVDNKRQRKVRKIARLALSPSWECQNLFRLVRFSKAKKIIELGTSLGVSALYLREASRDAQVITLEGSPEIARIARAGFVKYYQQSAAIGLKLMNPKIAGEAIKNRFHHTVEAVQYTENPRIIVGQFEDTLPLALEALVGLDLVFIDGNHRLEPTIRYFEQCLAYAHPQTVFVFDDIHWSEEMIEAWQQIKQHPRVTLTIDLFWTGIVYIRPEQRQKEHYTLIKSIFKPFNWGLW